MSDIISRRQRTPWFWPDFLYKYFGDGREHDKTLKILHSFTYNVSNGANGLKISEYLVCLSSETHWFSPINSCRGRNHRIKIHLISSQVIRERAEKISNTASDSDSDRGTRKRQAFLDMLLKTTDEDGNSMSHQDIQEEVDTFMFRVSGYK